MINNYNICLSLILLLIFSSPILSQNAIEKKTISGVVTLEGTALKNVNILVSGTNYGTVTDKNGYYEIEASTGNSLIYSYVGLKTIEIVIEDITETLNISMKQSKNELDTAFINVKKRKNLITELSRRSDVNLLTPLGYINPKTSGLPITHVLGENLNNTNTSIIREIAYKSGLKIEGIFPNEKIIIRGNPAVFIVDGIEYEQNLPITQISQISDIFVLRSKGMIVIVPRTANHIKKLDIEKISEQYRNQNYYENDAIDLKTKPVEVLHDFKNFVTIEEAYNFFKNQSVYDYNDKIEIAHYLWKKFKSDTVPNEILNDLVEKYYNNPEVLKAIAFYFQLFGNHRDTTNTYMRLLNLRPYYAQSYRDLANAYKENNNFRKSWKTYLLYINNHYDNNNQEFINLTYNEMEYLYFNRKNQAGISENFVPKNSSKQVFEKDIRMVFEWNSSEAEFDIEFVGPEKRSFSFKHTLFDNQELINKEKLYGYSSKEFFIETLNEDKWLVNLTYYGNKKNEPTYLKLTTYKNWGKSQQIEKIELFKLIKNGEVKFKLKNLNKEPSKIVSKLR